MKRALLLFLMAFAVSAGALAAGGGFWLYTHTMWCDEPEFGDGEIVWRDFSTEPWVAREWLGMSDNNLWDLSPEREAQTRRWQAQCLQPNGRRKRRITWPIEYIVWL